MLLVLGNFNLGFNFKKKIPIRIGYFFLSDINLCNFQNIYINLFNRFKTRRPAYNFSLYGLPGFLSRKRLHILLKLRCRSSAQDVEASLQNLSSTPRSCTISERCQSFASKSSTDPAAKAACVVFS